MSGCGSCGKGTIPPGHPQSQNPAQPAGQFGGAVSLVPPAPVPPEKNS